MSDKSSLIINVKETIRFFDEKPCYSSKQATSIVGVVGEDLAASCFQHYLESHQCAKVTIYDNPVTTGKKKGPRLDRWIAVDWPDGRRIVFQTEIKNSSAHATEGKTLPVSATSEEVAVYKQKLWEKKWNTQHRTLEDNNDAKVLVPMEPPLHLKREEVLPLILYWIAIGTPDQVNSHLFCIPNPACGFPLGRPPNWPIHIENFPELWVFSVSSYLRSLPNDSIILHMPIAAHRLRILGKLFKTP
ncbi:MAG: hypothetical protein F4X51_19770 [Gemmatimonadetes bacterium]|nr:hypothetical protein [Gemmatimonadota bacterium]MYD61023.1 hypothetical protein [Gemmatimonadota bacterium]